MEERILIDGCFYTYDDVKKAINCFQSSKGALEQCKKMINEALPKFNWGASALDVNAITLLNNTPIAVRIALEKMK